MSEEAPVKVVSKKCIPTDCVDERFKHLIKEFECMKCENVVIEPTQCSKCLTIFCNKCIKTWHTKNPYKCPKLCSSNYKYTSLHRIVNKMLQRIRFHCSEEQCDYSKVSLSN